MLIIPSLPKYHYSRPELLELFATAAESQFVLVSAPMGYGKTVTMAEFAHNRNSALPGHVFWIDLNETYTTKEGLCLALVTAFKGSSQNDHVSDLQELPSFVESFFIESFTEQELQQDFYLLIDNFDGIDADVAELFACALKRLPRCLHVFIASRYFSHAFINTLGRFGLASITSPPFIFTDDEVRSIMTYGVSEAQLESVDERALDSAVSLVDGWPAGAIMAGEALALSLKHNVSFNLKETTLGVDEYFSAQTLPSLDKREKKLLSFLSLFDRFCEDMIRDSMFDKASLSSIQPLKEKGLLMIRRDLDNEWYSLNRLFAAWVRAYSQTEFNTETCETLLRVADWFEKTGCYEEAAKYTILSSDYEYNKILTDSLFGIKHSLPGQKQKLALAALNAEDAFKNPYYCALAANTYSSFGHFSLSDMWIQRFEQHVQMCAEEEIWQSPKVSSGIHFMKMRIHAMRNLSIEVLAYCDQLLNDRSTPYKLEAPVLSTIYQSRGEALERIGEPKQAAEAYVLAQAYASACGVSHPLHFNCVNYAEVQFYLGNFSEARNAANRVLAEGDSVELAFKCPAKALLAMIDTEEGNLESAELQIEEASRHLAYYRNADTVINVLTAKSLVLEANGRAAEAYELIVETTAKGEQREIPKASLLYAYFRQAELALKRENKHDLKLLATKMKIATNENDVYINLLTNTLDGFVSYSNAEYKTALKTFNEMLEAALAYDYIWLAMRILIYKVICMVKMGEKSELKCVVADMASLGKKHSFHQTIICGGEPIQLALREYLSTRQPNSELRAYVSGLLKAFADRERSQRKKAETGDASKALTTREKEVYELLNMGLSRKEISEKLFISMNTTKRHLASIYNKLGVTSKAEAVTMKVE